MKIYYLISFLLVGSIATSNAQFYDDDNTGDLNEPNVLFGTSFESGCWDARYNCDYTPGRCTEGNRAIFKQSQLQGPHSAEFVESPVRAGNKALKLTWLHTDPSRWNGDPDRVDNCDKKAMLHGGAFRNLQPGSERWYGWSYYLPSEGMKEESSGLHFQLHGSPDQDLGEPWRKPMMFMTVKEGRMSFSWTWDAERVSPKNQNIDANKRGTSVSGNFRDRWVDIVVHAKFDWTSNRNGVLEVWIDGNKVINEQGIRLGYNDDRGAYPSWGMYYSSAQEIYNFDHWLYVDEIRIGNENASLNDVSPKGGITLPTCTLSPCAGLLPEKVAASGDDGNIPCNTMDCSLSTRWSAQGEGQMIVYQLAEPSLLTSAKIAWSRGDERTASFNIEVSPDSVSWTQVYSGQSSGTSLQLESYDVTDQVGSYVRIVGYGNSVNEWNSITEVELYGESDTTSGSNQPPVAALSATPTSGKAPLAVNFDASSSTDADGTISSYAWDYGDGNSGSGVTTSHTYQDAGSYIVTLTLTDDDGAMASASDTITVSGSSVCSSPVNLALKRPVVVSGEENSNPGSQAVDGIDDTDNNRWSVRYYPQSLEVDLGSVSLISSTELVPYNSRGYQYKVEGKTTASGSYSTLVDQTTYSGGNYAEDVQSVAEAEARYVKLTVTGCSGSNCSSLDWISLREFKVNGCNEANALELEAEAGTLTSPMQVSSDGNASGGQYIEVPNGNGNNGSGSALYHFNVSAAGEYYVWGRVSPATHSDNSFYVSMDGAADVTWSIDPTSSWVWSQVGQSYSLGAGSHQLLIKQREDGSKLDRLIITDDASYVPGANARIATTGKKLREEVKMAEAEALGIRVYPNPGSQRFNLHYDRRIWVGGEVRVTDMLGREVVRRILTSDQKTLDLSSQQAGIYLITVSKGERQWMGRIVNE